jgi:hypothetical protein
MDGRGLRSALLRALLQTNAQRISHSFRGEISAALYSPLFQVLRLSQNVALARRD